MHLPIMSPFDKMKKKNKHKLRLYIALYDIGGNLGGIPPYKPKDEPQYHWALIVAPAIESPGAEGMRYLVRQVQAAGTPPQLIWRLDTKKVLLVPHDDILVRVMIAKITDEIKFGELVSDMDPDLYEAYNSSRELRTWIEDTVRYLIADPKALSQRNMEWQEIEKTCLDYAKKKQDQGRFDQNAPNRGWERDKIPTLDMMSGKEVDF